MKTVEEELEIRNAVAAGRESLVAELDARIQQSLGKVLEQLSQPVTHFASPQGPVTRKPEPPFFVPRSKYIEIFEPPDNLFQFC